MNYSGILYRIWAVGGGIAVIGLGCLLVSGIFEKSINKQCFFAGILSVVYGIGTSIYYAAQLNSPDVASIYGAIYEESENSRVAPLTMEYTFYDEKNESRVFYLDVYTRKEMVPDGFVEGQEYTIYYEADTNIIVGVEMN